MTPTKKELIRLHLVLDGEITLDNILLGVHSEETKDFPSRKAALDYLGAQEKKHDIKYEQLSPRWVLDLRSYPHIYVIQTKF